jgi:hypothetical protein
MIQVRGGGSSGTTKDREERFVPIHPKAAAHLNPLRKSGPIFRAACERKLLKRLKKLCAECGFENAQQYKLHTFRHHFASLCANNNVAYRKALTWLGHSSSQMLELYYHLHDEDSQKATAALADDESQGEPASARILRATGGSRIEDSAEAPEVQQLVSCMQQSAERAGFEPAVRGTVHTLSKRAPSAARAPLRCR